MSKVIKELNQFDFTPVDDRFYKSENKMLECQCHGYFKQTIWNYDFKNLNLTNLPSWSFLS